MRNGANKNEWNGMKRSFWSEVKHRVKARNSCEGRVRLPSEGSCEETVRVSS